MRGKIKDGPHQARCRMSEAERDELGRFVRGPRWECGGEFVCECCKRKVGWCRGGDDEDPCLEELCDVCWCIENHKRRSRHA
jgi:hypothetical protein